MTRRPWRQWRALDTGLVGDWWERSTHDGYLRCCRRDTEQAGLVLSVVVTTSSGRPHRWATWPELVEARGVFLPDDRRFAVVMPAPGDRVGALILAEHGRRR